MPSRKKAAAKSKQAPKTKSGGIIKTKRLAPTKPVVPPNLERSSTRNNPSNPAEVTFSSPMKIEDGIDKDEEEYEDEKNPQVPVSLTQFHQLEASLNERFQRSNATIRSFYEEFGNIMDDEFNQWAQHLHPSQQSRQFGHNPSSGSNASSG